MLGLYRYTLIIGHTSFNMISILNNLTLQKKFCDKNVFWTQKTTTHQQQNNKIKLKNPCRTRELNPGPLAPKADALPLQHRVN